MILPSQEITLVIPDDDPAEGIEEEADSDGEGATEEPTAESPETSEE